MYEVGFTCGAFDLLHAGHTEMLQFCARNCRTLVVGLHTNPKIDRPRKNAPMQSVLERYLQLMAVKGVEKVIPYDTEEDLANLLCILHDRYGDDLVRFVGADYKPLVPGGVGDFTGVDLPIEIIYNPRSHEFSSSSLRERLIRK